MGGEARGWPPGPRLLLRDREALWSADSESEGAESKWKLRFISSAVTSLSGMLRVGATLGTSHWPWSLR